MVPSAESRQWTKPSRESPKSSTVWSSRYTDGVTECPSPAGEEFGIERLAGVAAGQPLPDDASSLVVTRLPSR
jgi:hypothetical protein